MNEFFFKQGLNRKTNVGFGHLIAHFIVSTGEIKVIVIGLPAYVVNCFRKFFE